MTKLRNVETDLARFRVRLVAVAGGLEITASAGFLQSTAGSEIVISPVCDHRTVWPPSLETLAVHRYGPPGVV